MPAWGMWLFGLPFAGIGGVVMLIGTRRLEVDPATVHAPYWVLTVFGAVFFCAGILVWGLAVRESWEKHRRAAVLRAHVNEPALLDRKWDPRGILPSRWGRVFGNLAGLAGLALFLSIFNWWAFLNQGPWLVKGIVTIFDALLLYGAFQVALLVGRTIKFGASRIEYVRFPYRVGEPVVVRWFPPTGIRQINGGRVTLRCVEEWYETREHGSERSQYLIQEVKWRGSWQVAPARGIGTGKGIELSFVTPAGVPPTCCSAARPVIWQLHVALDLPGLDFVETYLVPVY